MFKSSIDTILSGKHLNDLQAKKLMDSMMDGKLTDSQVSAVLVSLRNKGETVEEITGFARSMKEKSKRVNTSGYSIDTCGTGGSGRSTFNISTAVSIISSAAGISVAKHGNKAVSSKSGSADVLLELGFNINVEPKRAEECLRKNGMTFLFAPNYHLAMKNVAGIRRELGIRTVFNMLGPLSNPADVKGQVLGVYDPELTNTVANVLVKLGRERALVVHGDDGLDEITTTTTTTVSEVRDGKVRGYKINPEDLGIKLSKPEELEGGDAVENAVIILDIFKGVKGAKRDIVVINSAAALYVGKKVNNLKDGIKLAEEIIDKGIALKKLNQLIDYNRGENLCIS